MKLSMHAVLSDDNIMDVLVQDLRLRKLQVIDVKFNLWKLLIHEIVHKKLEYCVSEEQLIQPQILQEVYKKNLRQNKR